MKKRNLKKFLRSSWFEKILLAIVGVVFANLFYTSIRASFKKATFFDLCSSLVEALVALSLCAISYLSHTLDGSFVALPLAGTLIAIMQLLLVEIRERYIRKMQANAEETEKAEQAAETVVQEEHIALPAISFGAPAREFPAYECKEEEKQDAFMQSLTEEEKKEFAALYLNKTANEMPEIPAYQAGGDNKAFFNHIFVYLGKYRENISDDLLEKLYDFSR